MDIRMLGQYEIPDEIIEIWKNDGYLEVLPIQLAAIEKGVFQGKSLLVAAPTSSGKTFIGEMASVHHALQKKKTIYLVPFKALAEEKYTEFTRKYSDSFGMDVKISDRDHREYDEHIARGDYDIAILTYEKLSALLVITPSILDMCECIIVDEVQMISDPNRGGDLELLLTKIKLSSKKLQIIALSAVIDNINGFDHWLEADLIKDINRPVELRVGVLTDTGKFEYQEQNSKNKGEEKFSSGVLYEFVKELVEQDEQVIVICNSVNGAQEMAKTLSKKLLHLPASSNVIQEISSESDTETSAVLLQTLRTSVAFHHADCELIERRAIENGFRKKEIRVIVATTTLSMGINLPCKTVILADNEKWESNGQSVQKVNWKVSEVMNILGRAGRYDGARNTSNFGRGILLAKNLKEKLQIQRVYLNGRLEPIKSTFHGKDIALRVLNLVASGFGGTEEDIKEFLFETFAAKNWTTDESKKQINLLIKDGIERCINEGLLQREESTAIITATRLGKVCASKNCSIKSFRELREYAENNLISYVDDSKNIDILNFVFSVACTDEVFSQFYRGIKWHDYGFKQTILKRVQELIVQNALSGRIESFVNKGFIGDSDYRKLAISLLVKDILLSRLNTKDLCKAYSFSTANIRNICLNMSWMVDVIIGISSVLNSKIVKDIQSISECIQHHTPLDCKYLNKLGNISREEKIKLVDNGYKSEDDFLNKKNSDFKGIINPRKAGAIIQKIYEKRESDYTYWENEHQRRIYELGYRTEYISAIYKNTGNALESAVAELFSTNFANCNVTRILDQSEAEPDLLMTFPSGEKFTIQVTAKESNSKFIDSKKAGDVIPQSARFHPDGYICLGRPDFQEFAQEQAAHQALNFNFKLLPIYVLAELFVRVKEGNLSPDKAAEFLLSERGYLQVKMLDRYKIDAVKIN